jgi:hypothetical protein
MGSFFGLVLLRVLDIPPVNQVIGIIFIGLPDTPVYALVPTLRFGYTSGVWAWATAYFEAHGSADPLKFSGVTLTVPELGHIVPSLPSTWLLSLSIWMVIICAGLYLAARRKA